MILKQLHHHMICGSLFVSSMGEQGGIVSVDLLFIYPRHKIKHLFTLSQLKVSKPTSVFPRWFQQICKLHYTDTEYQSVYYMALLVNLLCILPISNHYDVERLALSFYTRLGFHSVSIVTTIHCSMQTVLYSKCYVVSLSGDQELCYTPTNTNQ